MITSLMVTVFFAGAATGLLWVFLVSFIARLLARFGYTSPEVKKAQAQLDAVNKRLRVLQWKNILDASKEYHNHWNNQA